MPNEPLNSQLRALLAELARAHTLDPDTRPLADSVLVELGRLGASAPAAAPTAGGLEALAVRFEAEHPATAATLRQVADLLAKAGI